MHFILSFFYKENWDWEQLNFYSFLIGALGTALSVNPGRKCDRSMEVTNKVSVLAFISC